MTLAIHIHAECLQCCTCCAGVCRPSTVYDKVVLANWELSSGHAARLPGAFIHGVKGKCTALKHNLKL